MVAKINHGASLYGAIIYNQEKVNEGTARIISGNRMISNIAGNPENVMQQTLLSFESYLAANLNTRKPVLHISLNPSPEDKLTDEQFAALAKDYMEKMNYGDQPYIVYIHEDTGRRHIHIASVCVDETGRKIDDSYEYRRSMTACRELEGKFRLKNITNERTESDKLFLKKVEYEKGDVKHQISNVLKNVAEYTFKTFGEYNALLSCFGVEVKTVKGKGIDEKPFNGIIYSATDSTGKAVSNPFKSSLFGKSFGHEGLNKRMARNEKAFKEGKYAPMIRSSIAAAMKATRNQKTFTELLKTKGIDVVFRTNDTGRLYGITFIDHNRKEVYNGSALGKEFSANVFNNLFNCPNHDLPDSNINMIDADKKSGESFNHENHGSDIFGIFDFQFLSDERDYEEDAFIRQTKRRKKRKQQRKI
ncbi:mobilization protein [Bacteroidia bacterium]|nr:mobilization protein [Bacteroidia bacterium]GHT63260.1 mobilization protein [Bacteroidia bacterium]